MASFVPGSAGPPAKSALGWIGAAFIVLGALAILAPVAAAPATVVAGGMLAWGGLGLWMALTLRPLPESGFAALVFVVIALLGLLFLAFPAAGIEAMTLFLVAGFLADGVLSILFGLRLSAQAAGWGWMVASGAVSLTLGFILLLGWPQMAAWFAGGLLGINLVTTGMALLAVRRSIKLAGP